jgi:hypothetical protein
VAITASPNQLGARTIIRDFMTGIVVFFIVSC